MIIQDHMRRAEMANRAMAFRKDQMREKDELAQKQAVQYKVLLQQAHDMQQQHWTELSQKKEKFDDLVKTYKTHGSFRNSSALKDLAKGNVVAGARLLAD